LFLQNHDQIGNRALGERLVQISPAPALRAATALLLLSPMIPMLFMGDEWGASEPFLFFTDFHDELADAVREGRRGEFADFAAFADEEQRKRIPDPNALSTFDASRPAFDAVHLETDKGNEHQSWMALYRELLQIRHRDIVPRIPGAMASGTDVLGDKAVSARWRMGDGSTLRIELNLSEHAIVTPEYTATQILFESHPKSAELSQEGSLNPYTVVVSLTARDVLEEQDEQ
jgi:maltooligosyltrehalose trehalohydrolase